MLPLTARSQLAQASFEVRHALDAHLAIMKLEIVHAGFHQAEAMSSAFFATNCAASHAELPAVTVWRLANAPTPRMLAAVSPQVTFT